VFPRVAWPSLVAGNVTDYRQSMSGCSGVAYLGLRLVEGVVTNTIIINILIKHTPNFRRNNIKRCTTQHEICCSFF
jgi:hypothetical protein